MNTQITLRLILLVTAMACALLASIRINRSTEQRLDSVKTYENFHSESNERQYYAVSNREDFRRLARFADSQIAELEIRDAQLLRADDWSLLTTFKQLDTITLYFDGPTIDVPEILVELDKVFRVSITSYTGRKIARQCIERLSRLDALQQLTLTAAPLTDRDLQQLSRLPNVRVLRLDATQPSSRGIRSISQMTTLETLGVESIASNDVVTLAALENLQTLFVPYDARLRSEIHKQLPGCKLRDPRGW